MWMGGTGIMVPPCCSVELGALPQRTLRLMGVKQNPVVMVICIWSEGTVGTQKSLVTDLEIGQSHRLGYHSAKS